MDNRKGIVLSAAEKEVILRSWKASDDVSVIKDVATKGSYINMCIEYLAEKRKSTKEESEKYFKHHVNQYVNRLLKDKLVYKAESVLENVGRNVEHVYYQFAHSTGDLTVKINLLEHLKKRDPEKFDERAIEYDTYSRMLSEIAKHDSLCKKITHSLGELKLENLYLRGDDQVKKIVVIAYFDLQLDWLIPFLDRKKVWHYLISKGRQNELLIWTRIFFDKKNNTEYEANSKLSQVYAGWEIDEEMFTEAMRMAKPSEALKNAIASNGFIYSDEKENIPKILLRFFTSDSYNSNRAFIKKLPIVKFIMKNEAYSILLEDAIDISEIDGIKTLFASQSDDIEFITSLKTLDVNDRKDIVVVSKSIGHYMQKFSPQLYENYPVIRLFELLADDATVDDLKKPEDAILLEKLPYLAEVINRYQSAQPHPMATMEDFLYKFNKINLRRVIEGLGDQPISFSNEILCQKYAPKIQLNYLDFIRQNRSAHGAYCFFLEQFSSYNRISKSQLCIAADHVTEIALKNSNNTDLVLSCIAFIEMLGFDTKAIRAYLKLRNLSDIDSIKEFITPDKLIPMAESKLIDRLVDETVEFPVRTYNAIVTIAKNLQTNVWPELYLAKIAAEDNWLHFILFAQYFDIPLVHLNKFTKMFTTPEIGEHLMRAFSQDHGQEKSKRRQSVSRSEHKRKTKSLGDERNIQTTSMDTFTSSSSSDASQLQKSRNQLKLLQQFEEKDIFAIILLSSTEIPEEDITNYEKYIHIMNDSTPSCTSVNLMRNAVTSNLPILAILSAVMNDRNLEWCWATWLLTSAGLWKKINRCPTEQEFSFMLIENSVKMHHVRTLHQSFQIFFKNNDFNYMTKFLLDTSERNFEEDSVSLLRQYFQSVSNDGVSIPLAENACYSLNDFSIRLIYLHLKQNFSSSFHRYKFLEIVCRADLSRPRHDFELLKNVLDIIMFTDVKFDYESLLTPNCSIRIECQRICTYLENTKEFDKAIQLAMLLNMTISNIVYAKWIHSVEKCSGELDFSEYEKETELFILPPEILINFYLYVASRDFATEKQKYNILKKALDVIKGNHLLPNEYFDRDNIEYEMILTYLEGNLKIDEIDVYHSKYYEKILLEEGCALYRSFPELKELAGVDHIKVRKCELTENMRLKLEVLINKLLDDGDIVQALRHQAMFDYRPVDLHFIVFCMAMAEGITHIYNLPNNLRQLLIEVENNALLYNKRILGKTKSQLSNSTDSNPVFKSPEIVESTSHLEFEEIPSREKQEVLKALQGIVSRLNHGISIGKRILMIYRAAMHLDKEYLDVLKTKDALFLLRNAIEEDCLEKLAVISDILMSSQMTEHEVADFLSAEIATAVIRPRFYILSPTLPAIENNLWGLDLEKDFHVILELSPNTILLGNCLLDYCDALKVYRKYQDNKDYERDLEDNQQIVNAFDSLRDIIRRYGLPINHSGTSQVLSHKKQNTIYVELLIKAHECFVHELSMEGIANVLNRAKILNSILSTAKSWNLIVRMLTGIGRYREMYYCIDTLISNHQYESLLGQFDEEKTKGLRQALIQYIHEICPQNREYYRLTALHFSMFKELAEMWETEGNSSIAKIISNYQIIKDSMAAKNQEDVKIIEKPKLRCTNELLAELHHATENFTHATENYLMDNKLQLAQKIAAQAELGAMQTHLVNDALAANEPTCICVLSIYKPNVFRELINNDLSIPQALILQRAYSLEINWSEAILNQYILLDRRNYIEDFCNNIDLTDNIIENVVKSFQLLTNVTPAMEENMSNIIELVQSISLRYKLASLLGFRKIITALINDQSLYYLKDTNYGRNEIDFN